MLKKRVSSVTNVIPALPNGHIDDRSVTIVTTLLIIDGRHSFCGKHIRSETINMQTMMGNNDMNDLKSETTAL